MKKTRFFRVSHGMDNYEEVFDLNEIIFMRSAWSPAKGVQESGTYKANIHFRNGIIQDVYLSELGYEDLIKKLGAT